MWDTKYYQSHKLISTGDKLWYDISMAIKHLTSLNRFFRNLRSDSYFNAILIDADKIAFEIISRHRQQKKAFWLWKLEWINNGCSGRT